MPPSARYTPVVAPCLATFAPLRLGEADLFCSVTSAARRAVPTLCGIGKVAVLQFPKAMPPHMSRCNLAPAICLLQILS
jgi:hypothetical protein